jgi:lipoate-protein ligase A
LYHLGVLDGLLSMSFFHALAHRGEPGLVLCSPVSPYLSVGFFQDAASVLDLPYCRQRQLPVVRREVGGGAVLLDAGQVFFHLVLPGTHRVWSGGVASVYQRLATAPITVYRELGVDAHFRAVNDLVVTGGQKIAGLGGAAIGGTQVFVGSIILDFDYDTMVAALRVPDEKFRGKLHTSLESGLTTVRRETGRLPAREQVEGLLADAFASVLRPYALGLVAAQPTPDQWEAAHSHAERLASADFIAARRRPAPGAIKIHGERWWAHADHKAPGGLISVTLEVAPGRISRVWLGGDFTLLPASGLEELERDLSGRGLEKDDLAPVIAPWRQQVELPGVSTGDLLTVLDKAIRQLPPEAVAGGGREEETEGAE